MTIPDATSATGLGPGVDAAPALRGRSRFRTVLHRFGRDKVATVAAAYLLLLVVLAVFAPVVAPQDPNAQDLSNTFHPPGAAHWFGTDDIGRDLFSRVLYGGRLSLGSALIAVTVGSALGVLPGLVAGFRGGVVDMVMSRVVDAAMCIPGLILSIALVAALGPGIYQVSIAVGISFGPRFYRVSRGAALAVAAETYIKAARATGVSEPRILLRHVVPNTMPAIIVQGSLMFGFGLLAETGLSFLGLGAQPPDASWGSLLRRGSRFLLEGPYLSVIPGLMIASAVLAANTAGDGLQSALGITRLKGGRG